MYRKTISILIDVSASTTIGTADFNILKGGRLCAVALEVPDMTGSAALTASFQIEDSNGLVLYDGISAAAEDATAWDRPCAGDADSGNKFFPLVGVENAQEIPVLTAKVTLSGAEGSDRTFAAHLFIE